MSPRKENSMLDPSRVSFSLLPPVSSNLLLNQSGTPRSPNAQKGFQPSQTTLKKLPPDEKDKRPIIGMHRLSSIDNTPGRKRKHEDDYEFVRPANDTGQPNIAEVIDKAFGARSKSSVASFRITAPNMKPSRPPEDKSALYYDKLDSKMRAEDDDSLWNYVFKTTEKEDKEALIAKLKSSRSSTDIKNLLIGKRPQMIFSHLIKEYSKNKILPSLKLKDSPPTPDKSSDNYKSKVGAKRTDYNPLFDNLEQTGASLIANYMKKSNELQAEVSSAPNQNLMLMSGFLLKRMTNSRTMGLSLGLFSSGHPNSQKAPPCPSNLEHIQNNYKKLKVLLNTCSTYEHEQRVESRNAYDMCYIEHHKISNSSFGKIVCGQFLKIRATEDGLFNSHNPSAWNYIKEGAFMSKDPIKSSKTSGLEGSSLPNKLQNFNQKILVAKFSPDNYSLALGFADGFVVILQYNNENAKWDFFQTKSLVFGRESTSEYSCAVIDLAWSMVILANHRTQRTFLFHTLIKR